MQETQVQFLLRNIPWRRKWQATLVFLPGESHGRRSYSPLGRKERDTTEHSILGRHYWRFRAWGASLGQSRPSLIHSETWAWNSCSFSDTEDTWVPPPPAQLEAHWGWAVILLLLRGCIDRQGLGGWSDLLQAAVCWRGRTPAADDWRSGFSGGEFTVTEVTENN